MKHSPSSSATKINVKFAPLTFANIRIRSLMKNPLTIELGSNYSTLFQMAAQMDVPPLPRISQPAWALASRNGSDLKTGTTGLKSAKNKKSTARNSTGKTLKLTMELAAKNAPPHNNGGLESELKAIEFRLVAPEASSVKIAADFTNWEKCPLAMIKSENGNWSAALSLPPGQYSYRFIVDGEWCDDPCSTRRTQNPFGSANSVVDVV